ncbi:MAG: ATP-binding cassette domain-containing protein [Dongiaceae bacterium]
MAHLADRLAGASSGGDQRRVEIARALATRPRLLLLDEPAAGMNAGERQALQALIRRIAAASRWSWSSTTSTSSWRPRPGSSCSTAAG